MKKVKATVLLVTLFLAGSPVLAVADQNATLGPSWKVIDCPMARTVPLGAGVYVSVLAVNTGSTKITVFQPTPPGGWSVLRRTNGKWVLQREPVDSKSQRLLDHWILAPGEMVEITVPASISTRAPGKYGYELDLCVVNREVGPRNFLRWLHSGGGANRGDGNGKDASPASIACAFFHGDVRKIHGTVTVKRPTGKDKTYYDAYIRPWAESGDIDVKMRLRKKRNERSRELRAAEPPAGPASPPFSEIQKRQSFKELEDNRYAALAWNGGGSKITLLDTVRDLSRMTPGRVKYQYSPNLLNSTVASFERARYFVKEYGLKWQAYLASTVDLLGTAEEKRALKAIHEVAASSPDCVARYLAKRVLEVYDEVRGGKKH